MCFHIALATVEPQDYVVVEPLGSENKPLVSGCLVVKNKLMPKY